ncbi:hypothetical protein BO82DRAFT_166971 [Aspergillus uvarum CBS 121591]|uniref:Uncharacterized protein n=1 Tax=Aspergillus uvarum CBS 121591 TaxID=1448315 RepID=A0A319BZ72_9EURO|nr:hypothetical protein BO82DRAFT_166971 [Aspergillus uvarum CBS 121591]PYH78045.1 hypothetical protein BO82DRAFT_166971 [Aspergillus uvarum CBS 121591]
MLTSQQKLDPKKMELRGIEPRTSPMLREYYTTKPQPQLMFNCCAKMTCNRRVPVSYNCHLPVHQL